MTAETKSGYKVWEPLLLAIAVVIGMFAGAKIAGSEFKGGIQKVEGESSSTRVTEVIRFIEGKYVDDIGSSALVDKAINGILEELDPHSGYISPDELAKINERMEGHFEGIGLQFHVLRDTVIILFVNEDGPADKAGVKPHDRLIFADGKEMVNLEWELEEYVKHLRGPKGSSIQLKMARHGVDTLVSIEVTRDKIPIPSVVGAYMLDEETGYIKISNFSSTTYKEFMQSVEKMVDEDSVQHLVIDLRDNPGGYLKEAVNILSQLFDERGKLLVYTEGDNAKRMEYKTTGKPFYQIHNVAVLINNGSASASEIVAGAIQDHDRGVIIGEKSFGKGLVQEQYMLQDGGALRLTTARYYTPSGRSIQKPYENGFEHDGENGVSADSSTYRTDAGRHVYASGGISPDIAVESMYSWDKEGIYFTYDRLMEYMFYGFEDKYEKGETSLEEYLDGLGTSREMLKTVSAFFEVEEGTAEYEKMHADWQRAYTVICAMGASYRYGDDAWFRVINANDPVVLKGQQVVREDTRTTLKLDFDSL